MGGCGIGKDTTATTSKRTGFVNLVKPNQIVLLKLLYEDLATRSKGSQLTSQDFSTFFHLSGLWAETVFNRFDWRKQHHLVYEDFQRGIEQLVKSSFETQIEMLFKFYAGEDNRISYRQLLKMLYSYPKEDLKRMLNDGDFLTGMNAQERSYYFGRGHQLENERVVVEEVDEDGSSNDEQHMPATCSSGQLMDITNRIGNMLQSNKELSDMIQSSPSGGFPRLKPVKPPKRARKSETIKHLPLSKQRTTMKLVSNISLVVKKFATFLFRERGLNSEKDSLDYAQFKELIQKHTQIFTQYFEGFHLYAWQTNDEDYPTFRTLTSWYESYAQELDVKEETEERRYIIFIRNTLFVLKSKTSKLPVSIKSMEGLLVEPYNEHNKLGILIKHRDGLYSEKAYCFESAAVRDEWLRHLKEYCGTLSIKDSYRMDEKIGAGNFSIVYKAIEKETQAEVAVKVIEKFKLSAAEREVVKNECSILELCHHPRIAQFMKKIESKTSLYIVTELMKEGDLADYIKRKDFLEEYECSLVIRQLLEAVLYLGSMGIIHRDLKAENIMVRLNKNKSEIEAIKLIDFGFAIFRDTLDELRTKEKYVGTPGYAAPEIMQQESYDERVDMFSVGVIMYFMLAGRLPFDSVFPDEIYEATVQCSYDTEGTHWKNISSGAKQLLSKLLVEQSKRLGPAEALKHPWIREGWELRSFEGRNRRCRAYL